ncbi:MAG TPA: TonB-dependent receptor [Allosphingosinicella sp.]|jgi:TonB-dependent receptor
MRFHRVFSTTSSLAVLALASTAAAAQVDPAAPVDPTVQAQESPGDPEQGAPQTDDAVQTVDGADQTVAGEEEIVVTGLRRSLQSAQNIKRNSEQIVDSIVAEDIGKLPDLAVSDTAARIPGVQVIRTGGEASTVLIRGLPDFATTYNGREIFTAETRVVALQDFPSANIAALEVFKTTTPSLVEAGLAGLVNVRSRRPFDFKGLEVAGSVWGLYTAQAGEITPNGNILISNRWDTGIGEIGFLVNASYTQLKFLDSEPSNTDFVADPEINGERVRFPDIQRLFFREGDRSRPSANVALQWRPNDTLEFYIDGLYQGFRNRISDRLVAVPLYGGGSYTNLVFREGTNLLESGTVTGLGDPIFTFQGGTFNKTDTYQFAIGGIYESGPFKLTADAARTSSKFTGSTESVDRIFAGRENTTVDFDLTTPQFTIRGFDATNPDNFLFDGLYEENQVSKGDDYQLRADAEYEFQSDFFIRSLQAGVRHTNRDAIREFGNRFAGFRGQDIPGTALPLEFELARRGFRGTDVQSGFETFVTPTYDSIRENIVALRQFVIDRGATNYTLEDVERVRLYTANEKTLGGYGQINYQFGESLDGVIGLRVVGTKSEFEDINESIGGETGQKYTDFLPTANLRWRITPQLQARLSYTQTRTRPSFAQLNPAVTLGAPDPLQGGLRIGNGGNPNLRPIESNNYDLSLEYFFSRTGFASLAVFRRDLKGFIQDQTLPDFNDPALGPVRITVPVNTRSGRIDGLEAQVTTFFEFGGVPDFLRNFGVQANYTYLDGKVEIFNPLTGEFISDQITSSGDPDTGGVSKHTFNIAALYEGGPFSARLTYNKRSRYLDRRDVRGDEEGGFYREIARPAGRLDFSTSYHINDNFTVFFDATNLTGDAFRVDFSSARAGAPRADFVRFLRYDEQTFSLGARFRL